MAMWTLIKNRKRKRMREYTVREYDREDYDIQKELIKEMSRQELADSVREIARGWLPDYNFTGEESDYDNYRYQMIMRRAAEIIESEGK